MWYRDYYTERDTRFNRRIRISCIKMKKNFHLLVLFVLMVCGLYVIVNDNIYTNIVKNYSIFKVKEERTLPPIELTIRMPLMKEMINRLLCQLLRSAVLFWNKDYGDVVIILDEEDRPKNFSTQISSVGLPFNFRIVYEKGPTNVSLFTKISRRFHRPYGYMRMFYSSFLMDLYTSPKSIIAWTDTDVIFTMPVIDHSIFRNGKLIAKGANTFKFSWVRAWNQTTTIALGGLPMVTDFMTYFPVYVYPHTIKNCREFIIKTLKVKNFEEAFGKIAVTHVSPVNIIMSYAYYFERELYDWHIDIGLESLQDYNKKALPKHHFLNESDISPELHTTIHTRYYKSTIHPLQQAICYTHIHLGRTDLPECQVFKNRPNWQLFEFQSQATHIETWCRGNNKLSCISMINERYKMFTESYRKKKMTLEIENLNKIENFAATGYQINCARVNRASFL